MSGSCEKKSEETAGQSSGTAETRNYYDNEGWIKLSDGRLSDNIRWRNPQQDRLCAASYHIHIQRLRQEIAKAGDSLNLLECGCGGNPETNLLNLCARYTGVDFSSSGLKAARKKFESVEIPHEFIEADVCNLPFEDESFDAVYCAHMIYHIRDPKGQAQAFREIIRVTKKGGIIVLILANPRPLLFPGRLFQRLLADTPVIGKLLYKLRGMISSETKIPYNPRPIRWMRRQLAPSGSIEIISAQIASNWFNRHITERHIFGRMGWKILLWLESKHPELSARLGCYIQITICKTM